jgi:hypothetical protein
MSSQLFKELADKGTAEKLETALSLSNILYARSRDSSSQEAFLSTIVDLLQEAIDYLKAPETPTIEHVTKDVFVKTKSTAWTAERRAEQSAKLKASWVAKKAQQPPATE